MAMSPSASQSAPATTVEPEQVARSNAEDAYQAIRRLIVNVELPPGTAFTEQELVRKVRLGKTPVREALLRLKLERMVIVQARAGYRVAPVTLKDIQDTCRLLSYLEVDAARAVITAGVATERILSLAADTDGQSSVASGPAWIRADWVFHLGIARAHDNQRQAEAMTSLNLAVLRFRNLALLMKAAPDLLEHSHGEFVSAIQDRDMDRLAQAVLEMWNSSERALVTALSASEAILTTNVWAPDDRNAFYLDAVSTEALEANPFESSKPTRRPATQHDGD